MIAADDDRRRDRPLADQLVDLEAEAGAVPVAEPEDARRQPLKLHPLAGQPNPAAQRLVMAEHLERRAVGHGDVLGVARERRPSEWALALTEERTNVLRDKPGNLERV